MFTDCENLKIYSKDEFIDSKINSKENIVEIQDTIDFYKNSLLYACAINTIEFDIKNKTWQTT